LQEERNVGAVGGPGLTPPSDGPLAQAQGAILSSRIVSGGISSRYKSSHTFETDDIHSVNFVAWRKAIDAAGGWNEQFWPGEDTLLCLEMKKAGFKELLAPDVVVYHHRRSTWSGYFRQIRTYGVHRGYFAKRFPGNSLRPAYFLPSILIIALFCGVLISLFFPLFWIVMAAVIVAYILILVTVALGDASNFVLIFTGIPLTHLAYGIGFIQGLAIRRLTR
jgi:GT2 family glycosyltransferase